ncbi:unnamed protein product, partial [Staurois parvus]
MSMHVIVAWWVSILRVQVYNPNAHVPALKTAVCISGQEHRGPMIPYCPGAP